MSHLLSNHTLAREVSWARKGLVKNAKGKLSKKPSHEVHNDVCQMVLNIAQERGTLFQSSGQAYYMCFAPYVPMSDMEYRYELSWEPKTVEGVPATDELLEQLKQDHKEEIERKHAAEQKEPKAPVLIAIPSNAWTRWLHQWDLLEGQKHTAIVTDFIKARALNTPHRPIYGSSYMSHDAVYIWAGKNIMIKATADDFRLVPIGTDRVMLVADDLADYPRDVFRDYEELVDLIGNAILAPVAGAPSSLLTTRWAENGSLTPEQSQWFHLGRIVFSGAASQYPLWPIELITGEQNSGKSTAAEALMTVREGKIGTLMSLPRKEDALLASITTRSLLAYDNIDGISDDGISNLLCQVATGAKIDMRVLFTTNERVSFEVRNHAYLNARTNPFERSDVMRRVLHLETQPADSGSSSAKDLLLAAVLKARPRILCELLIRSQNMLRAHQAAAAAAAAATYTCKSGMPEYERFSYICASYEGNLEFARAAWSAYTAQSKETISRDNSAVYAIRVWLGNTADSVGKPLKSEVLHAQCVSAFRLIDQKMPYDLPHKFATALTKNESSLRVLGFSKRHTKSGNVYSFSPSQEEVDNASQLFISLLEEVAKRDQSVYSSGVGQAARDRLAELRSAATCDVDEAKRKAMEVATLEALVN